MGGKKKTLTFQIEMYMFPSLEDKLCNRTQEQVVPFLRTRRGCRSLKTPAVCALGHEEAALHQPINMREEHLLKEVSNLSIIASTTFADELCVS